MLDRRLLLILLLLVAVCHAVPTTTGDRAELYRDTTPSSATHSHKWATFRNVLYRRVCAPVQRHVVRVANGVYAIGRFINEASKKSFQTINSNLPQVGDPTVICEKLKCMFCTSTSVPSFDFNEEVCMEFALHPKDIGMSVKLIVDDAVLTEYQVSWRRPSDVKLDLGGLYNVYFTTRLYNNRFRNSTLYTCGSLELNFPFNSVLYIEMGCYYVGPGGAGKWTDIHVARSDVKQNNTNNHTVASKTNTEKPRRIVEIADAEDDLEEHQASNSAGPVSVLTTIIPTVTKRSTKPVASANENYTSLKKEGISGRYSNDMAGSATHQNYKELPDKISYIQRAENNPEPKEILVGMQENTRRKINDTDSKVNSTNQNIPDAKNATSQADITAGVQEQNSTEEQFLRLVDKVLDSYNTTEEEESKKLLSYVKNGKEGEEMTEDEVMKARIAELLLKISGLLSEEEWDELLAKYDEI